MVQGWRGVWRGLKAVGVMPLAIPWGLTNQRAMIRADVQRWMDILDGSGQAGLGPLLSLLANAQEFRNLYYFRLFKGNGLGRWTMYGLRLIYRPFPQLFLEDSCTIGPGLFIQHGFSTIIMADMGANCWINQQVTIGYKDRSGRPRLGDGVRVTAGAKVLGPVHIGDRVVIGANAVVVKDVPDDCIVVGIPARIVRRQGQRVDEPL